MENEHGLHEILQRFYAKAKHQNRVGKNQQSHWRSLERTGGQTCEECDKR